jgi:hypothetical protein
MNLRGLGENHGVDYVDDRLRDSVLVGEIVIKSLFESDSDGTNTYVLGNFMVLFKVLIGFLLRCGIESSLEGGVVISLMLIIVLNAENKSEGVVPKSRIANELNSFGYFLLYENTVELHIGEECHASHVTCGGEMTDAADNTLEAIGVSCCGNLLFDIDSALAVVNYGSDVFGELIGEELNGSAKHIKIALAVSAANDVALEDVEIGVEQLLVADAEESCDSCEVGFVLINREVFADECVEIVETV